MAYNETKKKADLKYMKAHQKRVSLNWIQPEFDEVIAPAIQKSGLPVSTFIKQAVREKLERENLL